MYADRLKDAIARTSSVTCLGLDPFPDLMPDDFRTARGGNELKAVRDYMFGALEVAAGRIPAVKPQSAFFERYGHEGVRLFEELCLSARERGLLVIADVKRGDIGSTAAAYAAAFADLADAVTVNPYMGIDSIQPFIDVARGTGGGLYVLVRTSNPSAVDLQDLVDAEGCPLYERTARLVDEWGRQLSSTAGSSVGAVVGATWPEQGGRLRELMPDTPFLIPGYGAQGGTAEGVDACRRRDGSGVLVNSSRGLLYAWRKTDGSDWQRALEDAISAMQADLSGARK